MYNMALGAESLAGVGAEKHSFPFQAPPTSPPQASHPSRAKAYPPPPPGIPPSAPVTHPPPILSPLLAEICNSSHMVVSLAYHPLVSLFTQKQQQLLYVLLCVSLNVCRAWGGAFGRGENHRHRGRRGWGLAVLLPPGYCRCLCCLFLDSQFVFTGGGYRLG